MTIATMEVIEKGLFLDGIACIDNLACLIALDVRMVDARPADLALPFNTISEFHAI